MHRLEIACGAGGVPGADPSIRVPTGPFSCRRNEDTPAFGRPLQLETFSRTWNQGQRTKQTLDPYYECQEEHDADYQQQQEQIEPLTSLGFCPRGIDDYLLVPVINFPQTVVTSTSVWVDSSSAISQWPCPRFSCSFQGLSWGLLSWSPGRSRRAASFPGHTCQELECRR